MTEQQLDALIDWIESSIDKKIEQAFGREGFGEHINEMHAKDALKKAFKENNNGI